MAIEWNKWEGREGREVGGRAKVSSRTGLFFVFFSLSRVKLLLLLVFFFNPSSLGEEKLADRQTGTHLFLEGSQGPLMHPSSSRLLLFPQPTRRYDYEGRKGRIIPFLTIGCAAAKYPRRGWLGWWVWLQLGTEGSQLWVGYVSWVALRRGGMGRLERATKHDSGSRRRLVTAPPPHLQRHALLHTHRRTHLVEEPPSSQSFWQQTGGSVGGGKGEAREGLLRSSSSSSDRSNRTHQSSFSSLPSFLSLSLSPLPDTHFLPPVFFLLGSSSSLSFRSLLLQSAALRAR